MVTGPQRLGISPGLVLLFFYGGEILRTAIVVDDEPITKMDLSEILQDTGFEVVGQGSDGFDAVELCRQYNPDVALMDIKMPVFDGLGAAETIIKEELAGCVVLLTAFSDTEFIEKAKRIGVSAYLVKPVEERTVLPTLEIAMAQSRRFMQAVDEAKEIKRQLDEKKIIDRAKLIISKRDGITEGEAYALLRKLSMNKRLSIGEIAGLIVKNGSAKESIDKAKMILMKRFGITENIAFAKIKEYSKSRSCTIEEASNHLISTYGGSKRS